MGIFAWLSIAVFALIAIIHILSVAVPARLGAILEYVNLPLHIAALLLLLFAKASLEILLLSFSASFLIYLVCQIASDKYRGGRI